MAGVHDWLICCEIPPAGAFQPWGKQTLPQVANVIFSIALPNL